MDKLKRISYLFTLALVLGASLAVYANAEQGRKRVLMFSSEDPRLPSGLAIEEAIRVALANSEFRQTAIYYEAQDHARIPNDKYESEYVAFLKRKYEGVKIDVIFVRAASGLRFLVKHESEIFIDTPKVFLANDQREVPGLELGANVTGVFGRLEFKSTLELILSQHPLTKRVVVITGSSSRDEFYFEQARKEFASSAETVEIAYLSKLSIEQLQAEVSSLPPDNVVLFVFYGRDPDGNGYSLPGAISLVVPHSTVPMYSIGETAMGTGIVGGNMLSHEQIGKRGAELGLRILSGERPADIPPETIQSVMMFDWNQLRRWNIREDRLPAGSIVRDRPLSAWEQYKWEIVIIALSLAVQSFLIGWLLALRKRRMNAETEALKFAALAKAEHKRLDDVVSNVPGVVWESLLDPETNFRETRFVSNYAEKMLGYSLDEWLSTPRFFRTIVLEEDREMVTNRMQEIFESGNEGVVQFRWVAKDSSVYWAEAHVTVIRDENDNPLGLRGVTMDITANKNAEEKVHLSQLELLEAQRLSKIGSWDWDPASDTVTWTEELYRIAGIAPSQRPPNFEQHKRLYTPESFDRLASCVSRALDTGESYELELELACPDGQRRLVYARGEVVYDGDHKITSLRGTLQDITDRKKAEEALAESEERYRNVVETQTDMICRYLPDTTLTFVNDAYCRYFGHSRDELLGTKFIDLIPAHSRASVLSDISAIVSSQKARTYQHEVIRSNGVRGWQEWTDQLVARPDGDETELQAIGRDITEVRLAEEALRVSETRFRIMADSAPILIWMCGPDKRCTYVNQGWLKFTGRSIDSELGTGWVEGIHPGDLERTMKIFDSAFMKQEPFRLEYRLRGADAVYRWLYDSGSPRFSTEGEFLGFIGCCVDISDRKEAEEEAKRSHEEVLRLQKQLHEENVYLKEVIKLENHFGEIIGHSDPLKYVLFKIEQVAPTDATVLIAGETGTGKELVARAIYDTSLRSSRPLVTVNCASLSATLIESELFGHEKGAFTGAVARKIGRFELADGATLFLDEVGELPIELQPKLLRVLQEGEFERLGSSKTIKTDVRIIAATNRDLESEVKNGRFREDLLFRLNVFPITVPPLRERKVDIPELIEHFTARFAKKHGKNIRSISPVTIRRLCEYQWPGNIRELANVIERSTINTKTETLQVTDSFPDKAPSENSLDDTLEMVERKYIIRVLELRNWKIEGVNGAALALGLNPSTLRTRMAKLGIMKERTHHDTTLAKG